MLDGRTLLRFLADLFTPRGLLGVARDVIVESCERFWKAARRH